MGPIYEFLGLSVGVVNSNQEIEEKIKAYKCDVIYATNNELGFDYLRDNMSHRVVIDMSREFRRSRFRNQKMHFGLPINPHDFNNSLKPRQGK